MPTLPEKGSRSARLFYAAFAVIVVLVMAWIEPLVVAAGLAICALLIMADQRYVRHSGERDAASSTREKPVIKFSARRVVGA